MSNAPSLKEPSMEEILASIRRIIESGDERSKPQGDILHDHPHPSEDERDGEMAAEGPSWDFGSLSRDFAPANADKPRSSADEAVPAVKAEAPVGKVEPVAIAASAEAAPAPVSPAETSDPAEVREQGALDSATLVRSRPRLPRREAMPRRNDLPQQGPMRDGLSLAGAFRRDPLPTAETTVKPVEISRPSSEAAAEVPVVEPEARDREWSVSTSAAVADAAAVEPQVTVARETLDIPGETVFPVEREVELAVEDIAAGFDEERFSSELHMAVGIDRPAPAFEEPVAAAGSAEPSVITAASSLMSEAAGAQVAAAFDDLARAIRDGQMKSMEEMAREMLRPMLQEWLDDNLPRIVERMVREEIERVSRGPRR